MGVRVIKLNYRNSCYLSAVNHVIYYKRLAGNEDWCLDELREGRDDTDNGHVRFMDKFFEKYGTKKKQLTDIVNYEGHHAYILSNKFIKKYADRIEDPDIIDMILESEYTKPEMRLYFTMKFSCSNH